MPIEFYFQDNILIIQAIPDQDRADNMWVLIPLRQPSSITSRSVQVTAPIYAHSRCTSTMRHKTMHPMCEPNERKLHTQMWDEHTQFWLEQNKDSIAVYNKSVDEQGAFSDGLRSF